MEVGAVAAMRYVADGIQAARLVMQYTKHTMLVGEQASAFAISMGLPGPMNLSSNDSIEKWIIWKKNKCQPNFRKNVFPADACGPYNPIEIGESTDKMACSLPEVVETNEPGSFVDRNNHDTIAMVVIDRVKSLSSGFPFFEVILWVQILTFLSCLDGTYCCWYVY